MNNKDFIDRAISIHGNKYDYSLVEYKNFTTKVKIICREHGEFEQKPVNHIYFKCNCPSCSKCSKIDKNIFIKRSNEIHNDLYDYSLVEYKNMHTKVKIICRKHGEFEQTPLNHLKYGCRKCSFDKIRNNKESVIEKFKNVHSDLYDYSLVEYKNMHTKVKILCRKHGEFEQTPVNHLQGKGCYNCSSNSKKNISDIFKKLNLLHNKKYIYNLDFNKTSEKIKIICKKHGEFYQTLNNHLDGHGCPHCNESFGEKKIDEYLHSINVKFIRQKKFDLCKYKRKLPFDFYLPDFNTCIEYDGEQHFRVVEEWGGAKNYDIIKKHDKIKNDFCEKNSIKLIRIKYNEDIIEKLNTMKI